ncbi:MAG: PAS domain S-box protein, partial [Promethearchaeota archaeon]
MLSNNSTKLMEIINDILSEISDWVWEVNKLGFFTYYSEGLKEFLGLTTKKMHELNLFDLFPNLQPKNLARLKEFRDYMKSKNKGMFEVILRAKPFFDNTTSLKGFRGTVKILDKIDVKTKNKEKYLPLIIKKFDDVILIIDEQYIIENKVRFNETSNYKSMEKDILNKSFLDLCHPNDIAELKGFLQKLKKGSENNRIECKILQGDGDYLWYDIRGLFFKEEKNALKYILILRNITTTRQKELLLYETVEKYQSFISNASEIAFSMDLDLRNLIIATPLETILGYFPDELKKKKIEDLLTSKSISNLKNIFKKELEDKKNPQDISKRVFFVDIEFIRKDCTTIILNVLISFLKNPDDNIQGIVGNLLKMTFYEDIKSKLLESEERYRTLFESSPHAIVLSNLKGEILGLNSKAEQLSGFKSSIFKGKKFQDLNLFPKEFFPLVMKDFIDLLKGKPAKLREIQIYKKDLTPNWVLYQGSMLNLKGEKIIQVIIQDIQDYKLIETKLRKSEKLYRNLFDNSPFGIWIVNSDGLIVDCNEGFNRYISDVPKEKIIGDSFVNMLTRIKGSKHKHSQIDHTYGNIRDDHCSKQVEFQAIGIDNKKIWITIENTIIKINKDIFFQIIIRNISDTKEAELKLQEFNKDLECQIEERTKELKLSEKHLLLKNEEQTLLLDNIDTQIWYLKDENTYGAVNKAHANFLGFNQELFENKKLDEILSNKDLEDSLANNIEVFKNKRQVRTESLMTDKFGSQRLLSIIKTPKLNESGEVEFVVCAAEDITNRHKT